MTRLDPRDRRRHDLDRRGAPGRRPGRDDPAPGRPADALAGLLAGGDRRFGHRALVLGIEAEELSTLAPWCLERAPKSRLGEEFIQLGDKQLRPVEIIGRDPSRGPQRGDGAERRRAAGRDPPHPPGPLAAVPAREARPGRADRRARRPRSSSPSRSPPPSTSRASGSPRASTSPSTTSAAAPSTPRCLKRGGGLVRGRRAGPAATRSSAARTSTTSSTATSATSFRGEVWERAPQRRREQGPRLGAGQPRAAAARTPREGGPLPQPAIRVLPAAAGRQELEANVADFERLIAPTLRGTVAELERTILAAGLQTSDLAAIYLAGGSSRIPLVGRLIQERLGVLPEHLDDPKSVIALGAARLERTAARESSVDERPLVAARAPRSRRFRARRGPTPQPGAAEPIPPPPTRMRPRSTCRRHRSRGRPSPSRAGQPVIAATPGPGDARHGDARGGGGAPRGAAPAAEPGRSPAARGGGGGRGARSPPSSRPPP